MKSLTQEEVYNQYAAKMAQEIVSIQSFLVAIESSYEWTITITNYKTQDEVCHIIADDGEVLSIIGEGARAEAEFYKTLQPDNLNAIFDSWSMDVILSVSKLRMMDEIHETICKYGWEWKGILGEVHPISVVYNTEYPKVNEVRALYTQLNPGMLYEVIGFMSRTHHINTSKRIEELDAERGDAEDLLPLSEGINDRTRGLSPDREEEFETPEKDSGDDDIPF